MSSKHGKTINIVLFSSLFPHLGEPTLGIFVKNRLKHLLEDSDVKAIVVAPVPWFPFRGKLFGSYGRAAMAKLYEKEGSLEIYHPRYLVIPKIGMLLTPFFLYIAGLRVLRSLIKKEAKIDIIDAHYLYPDGVAASRIGQKLNIPVVMTARGSDVTQIADMPDPERMILKALKSAAHTITVSQSLKLKLVSKGANGSKITPLRNGVDLEKFKWVASARSLLADEIGFDKTKPILVFAGWLIPRKRVDIVIDVIAQHLNAVAFIIGEGPLMQALQTQADESNVSDRVFFLGQKQPHEMPLYFSAADILMLPSEREGWANVLLEAMACGTPVVSRAVDGACELVTKPEAGRLVDERGLASAYTSAVVDLLENKPSRSDVRNYALGFDWRETSRGQYDIFTKAIAEFER
ncbi:glycosyltransferase [Kordiimonas aquimaris]|uniref:glycosyltransferase n=1 Tax=Kordiimonas aquimaris TaxID=707591 RepID=UPI0021D14BA6|nr:glycosyltransferase [Kordiimonas aquimaris]